MTGRMAAVNHPGQRGRQGPVSLSAKVKRMQHQFSWSKSNQPQVVYGAPAPATHGRPVRWEDFGPDFAGLLSTFAPISLSEMSSVALQDRTDTKYVMTERQLYAALAGLADDYRVLDIDGVRLNHYRTLYFDTADFELFQQHHSGRRERYKVRSRSYVDSRLSFLEVKHKVSRSRTVKSRIATDAFVDTLTPAADGFLQEQLPFDPATLEPKLWNEYTRITLVSLADCERVTLDLNLSFSADGRTMALPGITIAEVKQNGINRDSAFVRRMRALNLRPTGFSKYCAGVSLLYSDVKHNNFKPHLRTMSKLIRGDYYVQ